MARDGIARGVRGNSRKPLLYQHRLNKFLRAFDLLLEGKATPEYVSMRSKKLREVRHMKHG